MSWWQCRSPCRTFQEWGTLPASQRQTRSHAVCGFQDEVPSHESVRNLNVRACGVVWCVWRAGGHGSDSAGSCYDQCFTQQTSMCLQINVMGAYVIHLVCKWLEALCTRRRRPLGHVWLRSSVDIDACSAPRATVVWVPIDEYYCIRLGLHKVNMQ